MNGREERERASDLSENMFSNIFFLLRLVFPFLFCLQSNEMQFFSLHHYISFIVWCEEKKKRGNEKPERNIYHKKQTLIVGEGEQRELQLRDHFALHFPLVIESRLQLNFTSF